MPQLFYKSLEAHIKQGKDDARLQAIADAKQLENVRFMNMSEYDKELNRQKLEQFAQALKPALAPAPAPGSDLTPASLAKAVEKYPWAKQVAWKNPEIIQKVAKILANDLGFNLYAKDFAGASFAQALDAVNKAEVPAEVFARVLNDVVSKKLSKISTNASAAKAAKAVQAGTDMMRKANPLGIGNLDIDSPEPKTRQEIISNLAKNVAGTSIRAALKNIKQDKAEVKRVLDDMVSRVANSSGDVKEMAANAIGARPSDDATAGAKYNYARKLKFKSWDDLLRYEEDSTGWQKVKSGPNKGFYYKRTPPKKKK